MSEQSEQENKEQEHKFLPVVPMRDIVIYPQMMAPIFISRKKSLAAVENAVLTEDHKLILVAQRNLAIEEPKSSDLYEYGVLVKIVQVLKFPDGSIKALADGIELVKILEFIGGEDKDEIFTARYESLKDISVVNEETEAMLNLTVDKFKEYIRKTTKINADNFVSLAEVKDAGKLSDIIATYLSVKVEEKQKVLELLNTYERLEYVSRILSREIELIGIEEALQEKVRTSWANAERVLLREKIKAIKEELALKKVWTNRKSF